MSLLKTWTNAWTTSRRYHEATVQPCFLGCECSEDDLAHYLQCDPFWTLLVSAGKKPKCWLDFSPGQKLGLVNPTLESLQVAVVASRAYHTLRYTFEDGIRDAIDSLNFDAVYSRLLEIMCSEFADVGV